MNKRFISEKTIKLNKFKNYNEIYEHYKNDFLVK